MKKLLYLFAFCVLFLTGCEKKSASLPPESLFLMKNGETNDGLKIGDTPSQFRKAYSDYTVQIAYDEPNAVLRTVSMDNIPFEEDVFTIISGFFINGEAVSEAGICKENQIEQSELHDLLSSADYLRSHEVIYRYLVFEWQDGRIEDIDSNELNYNETFEIPLAD